MESYQNQRTNDFFAAMQDGNTEKTTENNYPNDNRLFEKTDGVSKKWRITLIIMIASFVGFVIWIAFFDPSNNNNKKYQINNTQDWVDFVSSASGAKEIDKCFMSMSPRQIINIYEEMVPAIVHITTQEFDAKSKCRAFMWLYCGIIAHSDRFTAEQYNQIENRDSNEDMAWRICFTCIGSEADEISKEYGGYLHGK